MYRRSFLSALVAMVAALFGGAAAEADLVSEEDSEENEDSWGDPGFDIHDGVCHW